MELGKFLVDTRCICLVSVSVPGIIAGGCPKEAVCLNCGGAGGAGMSILYGILWGVGGLTFGLSMRYLGVALGQSISLGTCAGFRNAPSGSFCGNKFVRR